MDKLNYIFDQSWINLDKLNQVENKKYSLSIV